MPVRNEILNTYSAWKVSKQLRKIKKKSIEYKGGKCIMCGYNKCTTSMVFHHRNPEEKEFCIGHKLLKWETIKPELDKCDLLCMNCHGEVHEVEYQRRLIEKERFIRSIIPERRNKSKEQRICQQCKCLFNLRGKGGNAPNKYCSVKCARNAIRKIPNDPYKLQEMINTKSINDLSVELGVTKRAIQKVCKKLNIQIKEIS